MKRILFVDDDDKILDGIRRMLHSNRNRWDMHFAIGGAAALEACEKESFDVVVTDMRMPGMDGATLLGHIRDHHPNTTRIVLSGYSDAALATRSVSVAHRFLAKPCSATELQSTIERVCTLQDLVGSQEIRRIVGKTSELPSLSTTYLELTNAVSDPDTSINQVAAIIAQDVAMSAKILQMTNSAFFGLSQNVTSLASAVSYLGTETIKHLALASEVFRVFKPDSRIPQSVCDSMQRHALSAASIVRMLPMEPKLRDASAVAALLHDIGSLFLASAMPDEFCSILSLANERGCKAFEVEEELLGTSHAEIGAYLLGLWGIPDIVVEPIAHHHHPTRIPHSTFDPTTAIYITDLLAHELEAHPEGSAGCEIAESDRAYLETLGVLSRLDEFRELAAQSRC
jgi:HD-like signal output (HDOD) protein/CheY-like chemotaxis protein